MNVTPLIVQALMAMEKELEAVGRAQMEQLARAIDEASMQRDTEEGDDVSTD